MAIFGRGSRIWAGGLRSPTLHPCGRPQELILYFSNMQTASKPLIDDLQEKGVFLEPGQDLIESLIGRSGIG
jgi:hypothetical protein